MNPVSFSLGSAHSLFVNSNGGLFCVGNNQEGQLGLGGESPPELHQPHPSHLLPQARQVACGSHHTLVLDTNERLWSFGAGGDGRLGNNSAEGTHTPHLLHSVRNVRYVSAGWRHSALIDGRGILWTFGCNLHGQLGMGDHVTRGAPALVMDIDKAYQVSCGGKHTATVDCYGNLWTFGENAQGQLGVGHWEGQAKPAWVSHVPNARFVSAGWEHTAVIDAHNNLWTFGSNEHGQLGLPDEQVHLPACHIPTLVMSQVKSVACGGAHTIAIDVHGNVFACGSNNEGQCGQPQRQDFRSFIHVAHINTPAEQAACSQSSAVLDNQGRVWAFGANCQGELGPHLSQFDKRGNITIQAPAPIPDLQLYQAFTRVKSSRNVCRRNM